MRWKPGQASAFRPLETWGRSISEKDSDAIPRRSRFRPPALVWFTRIFSSWAALSVKTCLQLRETSAPMTFARADFAGPFTPSLTPASWVTTPGPGTPGNIVGELTVGAG